MKSAFGGFFKELWERTLFGQRVGEPTHGARPCFPEQLCGDASAMLRVRAALRHRWEEALGITFGAHGKEVNRTVLVLTSPPSSISLRAVVYERMLARGTNVLQASGVRAPMYSRTACIEAAAGSLIIRTCTANRRLSLICVVCVLRLSSIIISCVSVYIHTPSTPDQQINTLQCPRPHLGHTHSNPLCISLSPCGLSLALTPLPHHPLSPLHLSTAPHQPHPTTHPPNIAIRASCASDCPQT